VASAVVNHGEMPSRNERRLFRSSPPRSCAHCVNRDKAPPHCDFTGGVIILRGHLHQPSLTWLLVTAVGWQDYCGTLTASSGGECSILSVIVAQTRITKYCGLLTCLRCSFFSSARFFPFGITRIFADATYIIARFVTARFSRDRRTKIYISRFFFCNQ
jgi:hypothetical protein